MTILQHSNASITVTHILTRAAFVRSVVFFCYSLESTDLQTGGNRITESKG